MCGVINSGTYTDRFTIQLIYVDTFKYFHQLSPLTLINTTLLLLQLLFLLTQMQEELERGQTFVAPVVNVLHEAAEAARTNSTYVQQRLAGE